MADFLSDLFANPTPDNYYAEAANRLYAPAREAAISGISAEKGEAEQTAAQRNQIQGITGPLAVENQERNQRLVGEAGGRTLNALDEAGRQAAYAATDKDRQEYLNKVAAHQQAIFDSFKLGAGLLTGAWKGMTANYKGPITLDKEASDYADMFEEQPLEPGEVAPDINEQ